MSINWNKSRTYILFLTKSDELYFVNKLDWQKTKLNHITSNHLDVFTPTQLDTVYLHIMTAWQPDTINNHKHARSN